MNRRSFFTQHFGPESELFRHLFHRWLGVSFISLNGQIRQENHTKTSLLRALPVFRLLLFLLGNPAGASAEERHTTQSQILIKGTYAIFIKYALIKLDEITL